MRELNHSFFFFFFLKRCSIPLSQWSHLQSVTSDIEAHWKTKQFIFGGQSSESVYELTILQSQHGVTWALVLSNCLQAGTGQVGRNLVYMTYIQKSFKIIIIICLFTFCWRYIEGSWPEWCISTLYHAWDTPFWSGTRDMYVEYTQFSIGIYIQLSRLTFAFNAYSITQ